MGRAEGVQYRREMKEEGQITSRFSDKASQRTVLFYIYLKYYTLHINMNMYI